MRKVLVAAMALAAGAAFAQMKPGLWEISQTMHGAPGGQMDAQMAQAQQRMANLPPEQRKMVEQMMAQRGMQMGTAAGGGHAMTMKMCMTKEMVERNQMPSQQRGDCTTSVQPRVGNTTKMTFTCTNPPSTGEGTYTLNGPDAYTMKMVVNTTVQGKPETMNMEGSGKWLGADCGDIKPIQPRGK
jgi:hypothetical protein